ncbi:MAG TPA: ribonuclease P protein component [Candidatus Saccharimonadia bacterium]|nr:ribonuclease P protein component [Candidatus Saccharimonadia bacterium]
MADQRFPRAARLLAKAQFDAAFQAALRFKSPHFRLHVLATGEPARLGLAIAKRVVRDASDRNRIKRHAREAFRRARTEYHGHDFVLSAHAAPTGVAGVEIERELAQLFERGCAPR